MSGGLVARRSTSRRHRHAARWTVAHRQNSARNARDMWLLLSFPLSGNQYIIPLASRAIARLPCGAGAVILTVAHRAKGGRGMELSRQIAEKIVAEVNHIIPQKINLMDPRGIIIASTRSRACRRVSRGRLPHRLGGPVRGGCAPRRRVCRRAARAELSDCDGRADVGRAGHHRRVCGDRRQRAHHPAHDGIAVVRGVPCRAARSRRERAQRLSGRVAQRRPRKSQRRVCGARPCAAHGRHCAAPCAGLLCV